MSDELSHLCNSYIVQLLNMTVYYKYYAGKKGVDKTALLPWIQIYII